jgi:hypothetical protein
VVTMPPRVRDILYYAIPMLFCTVVHWIALKTWFYSDDFAWLGLGLKIHSAHDLLLVLFRPEAQGTVRTFSERLFFLVFSSMFGLAAAPFRIWVLLTQFANIALLIQIARRLTASSAAGFLAGVLWTANAGLALALSWTSAYNEIASAFCILLAFRLLLLYVDTGKRKYWIWQWIVFLLGFGMLELNVVYPALAAGYAFICAPRYLRKTLYLFIPSLAFTVLHLTLIPGNNDPSYKMHFGKSLFVTLWDYWAFAIGAVRSSPVDWRPLWLGRSLAIAATLALIVFVVRKIRQGQWLPLFLAAWFLVVVLPFLPLKNHFTEYYVTAPAIGLAMLSGWAIVEARRVVIAVLLAAVYLTVSITDIHLADKYYYERARKIKHLMAALQNLPASEKDKTILVRGVDNDLYALGFSGDPFRLIGIKKIFLAPGSEAGIDLHPEWGASSRFVISPTEVSPLIRENKMVLLDIQGDKVRDETQQYLTNAAQELIASHPEFVDVGDPLQKSRLGPTWYDIENGFRWMPQKASVKIAGPVKVGQVLTVTGYRPQTSARTMVSFKADGVSLGGRELTEKSDSTFTFKFPLPPALVGRTTIEIEIYVDRVFHTNGDTRSLGLVFGTFAIE